MILSEIEIMTDTILLSVKWGKESFDISFDTSLGVKGLKANLQEKTGVPVDRMKIMPKSKGAYRTLQLIFTVASFSQI